MAKKKTAEPEIQDLPEEDAEELEEVSPGIALPRKRHGGGRPPKYRPEYAKTAEVMLRRGATIGELAEAFGVTNSTIHAWRNQHAEFSDKFSELSEATTPRVIRSLAELATGYTQEVPKVFVYKGIPMTIWVREHIPPSFQAIRHYLAVKDPAWRIKEEVELTGNEAFAEIFRKMGEKKQDEPS